MPHFFTNAEGGPAQFDSGELIIDAWNTGINTIDLDLDATFVGDAPTIPAGATGVILRFIETGSSAYAFGARHPDSSTNRIEVLPNTSDGKQVNAYVGINSSHEIDIYIGNTGVEVYLIGYFPPEDTFFSDANQLTFTTTLSSTWESVDLSAKISSDAVFAIVEIQRSNTTSGYNFSHPSIDGTRTHTNGEQHQWIIVPVDNQNVKMWTESIFTTFVLVGEITSNAVNKTSGVDVSLGNVGSYQTVDFSGDSPPANAVFAVVEFSTTSFYRWAVRRYGDTNYDTADDIYGDIWSTSANWALFPLIDSDDSKNERCQAKIENVGLDFYVWGYITEESGDLPINSTDQSQQIDNIDLVQQNILSINDIIQSQSIGNIDLIQANILIINNIDQSQSIDNIILQTGITLQINDISQAQSLENIDLIQANVLAIDDISQTQSIDNITLSAGVLLQIADIAQNQNIDIINLIQQSTISIDDIEQVQTVDNIILDIGVILQIADIIQSQTIDNLNLSQANTLAINDLLQSQSIDTITFARLEGKVTITFALSKPGTSHTLSSPGIIFTGE